MLALGYAGMLSIVTWQAMRAQSLIHPDSATLAATGGLAAIMGLLLTVIYLRNRATEIERADDPTQPLAAKSRLRTPGAQPLG